MYTIISHWELDGSTWLYTLEGVTKNWREAVGIAEIAFDNALRQDKRDAEADKEELVIEYEDHCWYDGEDGSWRWSAKVKRKYTNLLTVLILQKESKDDNS